MKVLLTASQIKIRKLEHKMVNSMMQLLHSISHIDVILLPALYSTEFQLFEPHHEIRQNQNQILLHQVLLMLHVLYVKQLKEKKVNDFSQSDIFMRVLIFQTIV